MTQGFWKVDQNKWEFANEGFLRGQKHLLKNICRKKPSHTHNQAQQPQAQNASISACVEVGKFGLDEEIERLKRDKNVLMQELVRLRQQQQVSDNQLQTLGKRLQGMERCQQLMMSFLAKAMQNPGLFAQLVQQNESNRRVDGVSKKRRLPRQSNGSMEDKSASPDGQIIEYQPLDPMATMVAQMLKFDRSRLEPMNNCDDLLVDDFSSPGTLDGGSSGANPGTTLAEVPQNPGVLPSMPVSSSYSTASSSSAASEEIQSVAVAVAADVTMPDAFQDINILSMVPEAVLCEFSEIQGMIPDESMGDIPIENFIAPKHENICLDQITTEVDGSIPVEGTVDALKLSEYIDSLLSSEDIIIASPQSVETTEEVVSSAQGAVNMQQAASGSSCNNNRYMDNLTTQMGLLASDS